jgi:acetyl-CoA C-acetyltransferase
MTELAGRIAQGNAETALLCGAEAFYSQSVAQKLAGSVPWAPETECQERVGDSRRAFSEAEQKYDWYRPTYVYAMFENAFRHHRGQTLEEERRELGEITSELSRVAMNNPYAQLKIPGYNFEMAKSTPMLCYPLRLADMCPTSDAACAMIFVAEDRVKKITDRPAWVKGTAAVSAGVYYADRDWAVPIELRKAAEIAYKQAGIKDPLKELDVIELYNAFSWQELVWYEGIKLCDWGEGGRLFDKGITAMTGSLPSNPSGGVLCANSIGAAAMFRKAEAALQVMGKAGARQVQGAKLSLGHGWGGAIQFHTIMIFGSEK